MWTSTVGKKETVEKRVTNRLLILFCKQLLLESKILNVELLMKIHSLSYAQKTQSILTTLYISKTIFGWGVVEWCWLCSREAQTDHWAGLGLAPRAPHSPMTWLAPPLPPPARHQVAPGETTRSREREVGFLLQNWPLGPPRRAIGWVCLLRTPCKDPYNRKKRDEKQTNGYKPA